MERQKLLANLPAHIYEVILLDERGFLLKALAPTFTPFAVESYTRQPQAVEGEHPTDCVATCPQHPPCASLPHSPI
jgi:hypothetical protein